MITKNIPKTWQELQNQVALILSECGFDVEVEKKVSTARGVVELDVYAEEIVKGRKYTIICECKYWKSNIPQTIVHSFRSVVSDLGGNVGYIVSLNGFQSGSKTASDYTNIELVTWESFQEYFEESWLENYFCPKITENLDPILTYTEPLAPLWYGELSDYEKQEYARLHQEYLSFGLLIMNFTHYQRIFSQIPFPKLPIIEQDTFRDALKKDIPLNILTEKCYREFLEASTAYGVEGIKKFRKLRDQRKV